jgi:hypothetical protein
MLGFKELEPQFGLRAAANDVSRLPTASSCFNLLKLPPYRYVSVSNHLQDFVVHGTRTLTVAFRPFFLQRRCNPAFETPSSHRLGLRL